MPSLPTRFWGLLEYKPQWTLSLRGVIALTLFLTGFMIWLILFMQPFLALSAPVDADVLIVEGWVNDGVLKGAIAEFERGQYHRLITTGSPIVRGSYLSQYANFAELAAATCEVYGLDRNQIIVIPTPKVQQNRTLASAQAVKSWLQNYGEPIRGVNLYSADVHTRRSYELFRRALTPEYAVGAIAHPPRSYNPRAWWQSSTGARTVLSEAIAYLYSRVIL